MEPSTSEEDNRRAQLEAIFRAHVADLYRYIYRQVHQAVIAEDLTSSVFLKALRWLQQEARSLGHHSLGTEWACSMKRRAWAVKYCAGPG